jgi:uncharacterized membrane protein (Fun14 family)
MDIQNIGTIGTSLVSGSLIGILIGYAIKKILKLGLIIMHTAPDNVNFALPTPKVIPVVILY